jgi:hypothetical protein
MPVVIISKIYILISEEDLDLMKYKWYIGGGYVRRNDKGTWIYMHKLIAERKGLFGKIDHKDRDKTNNQRDNLRLGGTKGNSRNRSMARNNTSGYKGVSYHNQTENWQAVITVDHKNYHLGVYKDIIEAAKAYDRAAKLHFGEFAALNFN